VHLKKKNKSSSEVVPSSLPRQRDVGKKKNGNRKKKKSWAERRVLVTSVWRTNVGGEKNSRCGRVYFTPQGVYPKKFPYGKSLFKL